MLAVQESHHSLFSVRSHAAAVVCVVFAFVLPASAGEHNRLFGCVTDTNGHPIARAKVVAMREQDPGFFSTKREWKAETDKSTGCYEMRNLPEGDYRVALENSGFRRIYGHFGPSQGVVQFGANESKELKLTGDFPAKTQVMVGVANILANSRSGFATFRGSQLTDNYLWYYGGLEGWYVASLLPGFDACSTGPFRGDAYYKCELRDMQGAEFAKSMYSRITDVISSTAASRFPDLGPAQVGQCSSQKLFLGYRCAQTTYWQTQGLHVSLDLNNNKRDDFYIEFTVIAVGAGNP